MENSICPHCGQSHPIRHHAHIIVVGIGAQDMPST